MFTKRAGKRDKQRKLKLCVLERIKEKKAVLFAQFSSTLTKEMRFPYRKSARMLENLEHPKFWRPLGAPEKISN